jgi:hypothetical protein
MEFVHGEPHMRLIYLSFLLGVSLFSSWGLRAAELVTTIEKNSDGRWQVHYHSDTAITRLVFQRSPDQSRKTRWKPDSDAFEIVHYDGYETVRRADGKAFNAVGFSLTPTYVVLPKDYAPFSPFTDGGMLIHSGRFFVCAEQCDASQNQWQIRVLAGKGEQIIVDGVVHTAAASWTDSDSGKNIYIGSSKPVTDDNFISVIDAGLPTALQQLMTQRLPDILAFFSTKMGKLSFRPSLYASYSQTTDGSYGHQGGTLPGQIFMHWYGKQSVAQLNDKATLLFFAHEVAHLYQRKAANVEQLQDAWLHEGSAELFSALAYTAISADKALLSEKLTSAKQSCLNALAKDPRYSSQARTNPNVHYSCGLVLFHAIQQDLTAHGHDVFTQWQAFNAAVEQGKPATPATFLALVKTGLSADLHSQLTEFVNNPEFDAKTFFQHLGSMHQPAHAAGK